MNNRTMKVLEFDKILASLGEHCVLRLTHEKCVRHMPSDDIAQCNYLLKQTDEAVQMIVRFGEPPLVPIREVDVGRAQLGGVLSMGELLNAGHVLRTTRLFAKYLAQSAPVLGEFAEQLLPDKALEERILRAIIDEETMADDASDCLFELRRKKGTFANKIRDVLNGLVVKHQKQLQEPIVTMRNERYCLPVKIEFRGSISGIVHDQSASGQTLFIEPNASVELNNQLRVIEKEEQEEIERILRQLSGEIAVSHVQQSFDALVELDFIFARGKYALKLGAFPPKLNNKGVFEFANARHPLIASPVPIEMHLGGKIRTLVITGPNTGGKTVALKTLGLFALMAQSGLHLPTAEGAEMAVMRGIHADIGDEQSIEQSLSTFSGHMRNIVDILGKATTDTLLLFDELGAGTDPTEGAALAVAILEYAKEKGAYIAATTHYSEIKIYALQRSDVQNVACEFDIETLRPTYKLLFGVPGKSNAFAISQRLGLSMDIIEQAKKHITASEVEFESIIVDMEQRRKEIEASQQKTEKELKKAELLREKLEKRIANMELQRDKIIQNAQVEAQRLLESAKSAYEKAIQDVKRKQDAVELEKMRSEINIKKQNIKVSTPKKHKPATKKELILGRTVFVKSLNMQAVCQTLPDAQGEFEVNVGALKARVHIDDVEIMEVEQTAKSKNKEFVGVSARGAAVGNEIDLRGQTVDEALINVGFYLDKAATVGLNVVSIIHGKGTGVLRKAIADELKNNRLVKSYRLGKYGEGESGVTIVELR